jgi:uncharacterized protein
MLNDAHCHFFSTKFFATLSQQRGKNDTVAGLCKELGWDDPGEPDALADRWVRELDAHQVNRAALIASVPSDEASVGAALAKHPTRFVGYFMVNPNSGDAVARTHAAVYAQRLRCLCLFPAMHHVALDDERVRKVIDAAVGGDARVFVHCGQLTVGVRKALGLPSAFDLQLGDPLEVVRLANAYPAVPFIVPHFGAGFLRETLIAADMCPNIYLDTSSSNRWIRFMPGLTLDEVFRSALAVVGAGRILFGTDSSYFPRGWQRSIYDDQKAALDRIGVAAADQDMIFGGTFNRLFS